MTLAQLMEWARWLDSRFRIPGTQIRFGLDPLLSLIPGIGDLASPAFTLFLLVHALYLRVPRIVILRMILNAFIDAILGAIPIAGNVADVFWRANTTNMALVERHAHPGRPPSRGDYIFVFSIAAVFGLLVMVPFVLALWLAWLVWRAF